MKLKKTLVSVLACMLAFVIAFAFAACTPEEETPPSVTGITVEPTSTELDQGDTVALVVNATYDDDTTGRLYARDGLTFESSAPTVADVTANGMVSAVAAGTATITAKLDDFTASCEVTVHSLELELSATSLQIEKDKTATLTATVTRDGTVLTGDDAKVVWTSSNDSVASVNADGVVTAKTVGTANITATKGGQSATCAVEVYWEEPVGYNPIAWAEQNKLTSNTWGYWNSKDPNWANGGTAADYGVYTDETFVESSATLKEGYEYIGMGRITFEYEITSEGPNWTYQAFYRSSDNVDGGLLHYNHDYEVTFKIVANKSGDVTVNPYDDIRAKGADESEDAYEAYLAEREASGQYNPNHTFTLEADVEQTITVVFRHDDCGYVYQEGIYDNMGSALHLQLGAITDGKVVLSVWDFQYKDLGAAENPVEDEEGKHAGYVDPNAPVIPAEPALILSPEEIAATQVKLRVEGEGDAAKAIFQLYGTIDISKFDNKAAAEEWLYACYFDLQLAEGGWTLYEFSREVVTLSDSGEFLIEYDITRMAVSTGKGSEAYGGHFSTKDPSEEGYNDNKHRDIKLDEEHAVPGESITVGNKTYTIVNVVGGRDWTTNWGSVAIKVESNGSSTTPTPSNPVIGIDGDPALPEGGSVVATGADLVAENDRAYFILSGTSAGCTVEEVEAYLNGIYFDFQENGYNNGAWNGSWNEQNTYARVASVNADGTWTLKFDVTDTPVHNLPYTGHFKLNDGSNSDNIGSDLRLDAEGAQDGKSVTVGGKKYTLVNKVSGEAWDAWGCVALKVENA